MITQENCIHAHAKADALNERFKYEIRESCKPMHEKYAVKIRKNNVGIYFLMEGRTLYKYGHKSSMQD